MCNKLAVLDAESFKIGLSARIYKDNPSMNNVLLTTKIVSDGFSGIQDLEVGSKDLDKFIAKLTEMNSKLKGSAHIEEPYGYNCFIDLKMDKTGHVKVKGKLHTSGNELLFENIFEQTYLDNFVKSLARLESWQEYI